MVNVSGTAVSDRDPGDFFQQPKANLTSTASTGAATRVAAAVRRGVGIISAPA
jgi:hypothetical protein